MENIDFNNMNVVATMVSGFVIGIVSLLKQSGVSSKVLPWATILASIGLSVSIVGFNTSALLTGLTASFMASGIYSQVKTITTKNEEVIPTTEY